MEKYGYMLSSVQKTLSHTAYNIQTGLYDSRSVLSSASVTKMLCRSDKALREKGELYTIVTERAVSLYFKVFDTYIGTQNQTDVKYICYFKNCTCLALQALSLPVYFPKTKPDTELYFDLRNRTLAAIESSLAEAIPLRFSVLSKHGKIFLALPELEYIHSCSEISLKAKRLIDICDRIYNKFTLCT